MSGRKSPLLSAAGFLKRVEERREIEKRYIYGIKGSGSAIPLPFMSIEYKLNMTNI